MLIKITKPSVLLPIAIGILLGAAFFWLGLSADAPGACAIGIALAFGLIMLKIRNAGFFIGGQFASMNSKGV
ncbi:hypothetical protein FACS1894184_19040 [Clostridia bacterium]|nr:hypothetical protein FACS1894184_19040 [Clostridia bacterium]